MTIALFSDIHANLPALEAFFADLDQQKPDVVYCLGDLVGYHIYPNEVIHKIRERRIATIAGNHDAKVKIFTEQQLSETEKNYAYGIIGKEEKDYLATLPAHIQIDFELNNRTLKMLLVHGSPNRNDEYLLEDKDEADFIKVFKDAGADILCFGHSHKPYYRILSETTGKTTRHFHAINTGSVGKPKDGNPQGGYVLLKVDQDNIQVQFIRFDYDVELSAKAIESSPLPNELAERLRKAY